MRARRRARLRRRAGPRGRFCKTRRRDAVITFASPALQGRPACRLHLRRFSRKPVSPARVESASCNPHLRPSRAGLAPVSGQGGGPTGEPLDGCTAVRPALEARGRQGRGSTTVDLQCSTRVAAAVTERTAPVDSGRVGGHSLQREAAASGLERTDADNGGRFERVQASGRCAAVRRLSLYRESTDGYSPEATRSVLSGSPPTICRKAGSFA